MGDADINMFTMEQYLALTHRNQAPVTHDAVMLHVFPITLTGAAKRWLEEIYNFKQGGDDTFYQAWERYNDMLYKCPTHDLNSHQKVNIFYKGLDTMAEGECACYPSPPGCYTHVDNRPPFNEKKPILGELMNKHLEESTRRREKMEDWMKKLQKSINLNTRNQNASLNNLETQIEQLAKDYQAKATNEVHNPSVCQCKAIFANNEAPTDETAPKGTNELHGVSFICGDIVRVPKVTKEGARGVLPCQLPLTEVNPGSFTLPCTIGTLKFYAIANLGASVNIMPKSMFNYLKLTNLKETNMLVEMADMTKKAPVGIVENVMVKIDKFLFPFDFMIIDMLGNPNETIILGRTFLTTIHARIDVFDKEISSRVGEDTIIFDMNGKVHHSVVLVKNVCMINEVQGEESFNPLEIINDLFSYESPLCLEFEKHNYICLINQNNEDTFVSDDMQEDCEGEKWMTKIVEPETTTLRLHCCKRIQVLRNGEFEFWPICDPSLRLCNGGDKIHGLDEWGNIKKWECDHDDERQNEKGKEMSFSDLLLIKYGKNKIDDTVRARRYIEWCAENNKHYENQIKTRLRDYSFKEWLKLKIGHTNVNTMVKNAVLNEWVFDFFEVESETSKDPFLRSLEEYKLVFDMDIEQLADEYEFDIGKKGYVLDDIWCGN
ncbi:reverse transcriptase domain-containing protein [Tanacetum coccineum]